MTNRYNYLTVALETDIRDDDAAPLVTAISTLRGVLKVEPNISNATQWVAEERVRIRLSEKLWQVLYPRRTPE